LDSHSENKALSQTTPEQEPVSDPAKLPPLTTTTNQRKKRYRPSPAVYRFTYRELVKRDGEICQICGAGPPLDIDHVDGDVSTWELEKLRLLCRSCNSGLQGITTTSVKQREKKEPWPDAPYEIRRHYQLESDFEKTLDSLLDQGPLTVKQAEDRIAKITGSTQPVVRRWIDREVTPEGSFALSEKQVSDGRKTRTEQFLSRKRVP